jgi:hypothetical protein
MKLADRLAGTLVGNMLMMVVALGIPGFVFGLIQYSNAGMLSVGAAIRMAVIIFPACAAGGAGLWFTVTRDLAQKKWPGGPRS